MHRIIALGMAACCVAWHAASSQPPTEALGAVHFPVSCAPPAQSQFDHAIALLHNLAYPQDLQTFTEVAKTDSSCGMAWWGIAMSRRANPLVGPIDSMALREGSAAADRAKATAGSTLREREYIAAIGAYYDGWRTRGHQQRVLAYESAMQALHSHFPSDPEAAVLYALALDEAVTVLPPDTTYARPLRAAAILEEVLASQPRHPGALHYLIHTYDLPALAARGLDAASRYGAAAPASGHALHMPSHVYSMMGMWQESIAANQASLAVAKSYAHAMDFMVYAYLQGAQDRAARALVEQSDLLQRSQTPDGNPTGAVLAGYTAVAAIPARYVLERGAWSEAASLVPRHTSPVADAITYFVRAMGAARGGDVVRARHEADQLDRIRSGLAASDQQYWAEQVAIERDAVSAWIVFAEGTADEALRLMRSAADREDASQKHVAMENRLWPMRELLGELLLARDEPLAALVEFEASLHVARNRFRSVYGAAQAARAAGDLPTARGYYERLLALCTHADTDRPELAEARSFVAQP